MEKDMRKAGFLLVLCTTVALGAASSSALASRPARMDDATKAAIIKDWLASLGPFKTDGQLCFTTTPDRAKLRELRDKIHQACPAPDPDHPESFVGTIDMGGGLMIPVSYLTVLKDGEATAPVAGAMGVTICCGDDGTTIGFKGGMATAPIPAGGIGLAAGGDGSNGKNGGDGVVQPATPTTTGKALAFGGDGGFGIFKGGNGGTSTAEGTVSADSTCGKGGFGLLFGGGTGVCVAVSGEGNATAHGNKGGGGGFSGGDGQGALAQTTSGALADATGGDGGGGAISGGDGGSAIGRAGGRGSATAKGGVGGSGFLAGNGGHACAQSDIGDATAEGGMGGLGVALSIPGVDTIIPAPATGGEGGTAFALRTSLIETDPLRFAKATGGNGGNTSTLAGSGGHGGNAKAVALHGVAIAKAGDGGFGGAKGGNGGDAIATGKNPANSFATKGTGGSGVLASGKDGQVNPPGGIKSP